MTNIMNALNQVNYLLMSMFKNLIWYLFYRNVAMTRRIIAFFSLSMTASYAT